MADPEAPPIGLAIAGLGAIGREVCRRVGEDLEEYRVSAVSARDRGKAAQFLAEVGLDIPICPLGELAAHADIVLECAPAALLPRIAVPVLDRGKELIVLSVGALLENAELMDLAELRGGRITIPTGALLGLDAVGAMAEDEVYSVKLTSRKPPAALSGSPRLLELGMEAEAVTSPTMVFSGNAREAAIEFPASLNVAAALALAGVGPERTKVEVWADPSVTRNVHLVEVEGAAGRLRMNVENVPSASNLRTGRLTALSVVRLLRKRTSSLAVGT